MRAIGRVQTSGFTKGFQQLPQIAAVSSNWVVGWCMGIQEIRITSKLTSEWDAVASQQLGWGRRLQASQSRKNQCVWSLDWEVRFDKNTRSNLKHIRNMLRTNKNQKIELLGTKNNHLQFQSISLCPFFSHAPCNSLATRYSASKFLALPRCATRCASKHRAFARFPKGSQRGWFWWVVVYHLESRRRNSHVLVYHAPLLSHLLGVAPSTFTIVAYL